MDLKSHRQKRKLLQSDIAKKLNVDRTTISKWETGKSSPNVEQLLALSKILRCSVDRLLRTKQESEVSCKDE